MSHATHGRVAPQALALAVLPLVLLPAAAVADPAAPSTKAAIEHAERQAVVTPTHPTKAQIEHSETATSRPSGQQVTPPSTDGSSGLDATAWQLALSAALGAFVTGGVLVGSRRFSHNGTAVAS